MTHPNMNELSMLNPSNVTASANATSSDQYQWDFRKANFEQDPAIRSTWYQPDDRYRNASQDVYRSFSCMLEGRWIYGVNMKAFILAFTIIFVSIRPIVFRQLFPFAKSFIKYSDGGEILDTDDGTTKKSTKEQHNVLAKKITKYMWHITVYIFMFIWSVSLLSQFDWAIFNSGTYKSISENWPHGNDILETPDALEKLFLFNCVQTAWYMAGMVDTLIHERNRGDFLMMVFHHVLAILLIYGSVCNDVHRVGIHVTATLDISDITLYLAKLMHLSLHDVFGQPRKDICRMHLIRSSVLCVLSFVFGVTRIIIFGQEGWEMFFVPDPIPVFGNFLRVFVFLMWGLQVLWWCLITKMAVSQVLSGKFTDSLHNDYAKTGEDSPVGGNNSSQKQAASFPTKDQYPTDNQKCEKRTSEQKNLPAADSSAESISAEKLSKIPNSANDPQMKLMLSSPCIGTLLKKQQKSAGAEPEPEDADSRSTSEGDASSSDTQSPSTSRSSDKCASAKIGADKDNCTSVEEQGIRAGDSSDK